jgi:hypothetical protein
VRDLQIGDGAADGADHLLRLRRFGVGQQQHHLLAAVAGGQVGRAAQACRRAAGHGAQGAVAGRVAVEVVVLLEGVDIEQGKRQRPPLRRLRCHSASYTSSKRRRLASSVRPSTWARCSSMRRWRTICKCMATRAITTVSLNGLEM